jgi:hypothetical protein
MIDKLQQGGIITAPDPRPYRTPLPGLNPEAFRYNINSTPLDTSGMVQVLQFNENADLRRQQQAVLLEQAKIKKQIEESKLAFQKEKFKWDVIKNVNKLAYGSGAPVIDTKGEPFMMDIDNTNYIKAHFSDKDNAILETQKEIDKLLAQPLEGENMNKIYKAMESMAAIRAERGSDMEYGVEKALSQNLQKLLIGDVGAGNKVNPYLLDNVVKSREEFFTGPTSRPLSPTGQPTGWVFGSPSNIPSYVVFNPKEQSKNFEDLVTGLLTPISQDAITENQMGASRYILKTTKNTAVRDLDVVVDELSKAVSVNGALASFLSDEYGVNLFRPDNTVDGELVKNILKTTIKPQYEAAVGESKRIEQTAMMGASDPVVNRTIIEGNYTTNRSSQANVSYSTNKILESPNISDETKEDISTATEIEKANIGKAYEIIKDELKIDPQKGEGALLVQEVVKVLKTKDGELSYDEIEQIIKNASLQESARKLKGATSKLDKAISKLPKGTTPAKPVQQPRGINPKNPPGFKKEPSGIDWTE